MHARGLAVFAVALMALPASANHPQTASGNVIVFTPKAGGNEWWVEVVLSGQDAGSVTKMEAMDDGGPWVTMTYHPDWAFGDYAASFHVEPGHRVQYRASWSGGAQQLSCWFTHPAGVEQCGTPPPPPSSFSAQFTLVTGNEWWEQTQVTPSGGTVAGVDVRVNGGAWNALKLQSWGVREWAGSLRAVDGSSVQFRATSTAGDSVLSSCYRWLPPTQNGATATPITCGSSPPPPPPPSPPATAVFYTDVKGNEWWIEAHASSKSPIAGVDARVNGGPWVPMKLQSWGNWAVSTHAAPGSHVQLRARAPDGTFMFVPNGWLWTAATQWPAQSSTFDAKFENVQGGNSDWVQVNVYAPANWGLGAVRARVDGGAWQTLTQQSWGDWAAPIHVDDGAYVEFLAFSQGQAPGGTMSGSYVWPSARAVTAWPVEGSFVSYHLAEGRGSPGCCWSMVTAADLRLEYHGGQWAGNCVGHTDETSADGSQTTHTDWSVLVHEAPPGGPNPPVMNATTNPHPLAVSGYSRSCGHTEMITMPYTKGPVETQMHAASGRAITLRAWSAHHDPADTTPESSDASWETRLGIIVLWSHSAIDSGGYRGYVTDTDAPIK